LDLEIVLCQLIDSFSFSLAPGKQIYWQLNGIAQPGVEGECDEGTELKLQLPLMVSLAS